MKQLDKWQWSTLILSAILVMAFSVFIYRYEPFKSGFEITDQLGGNIFPATIPVPTPNNITNNIKIIATIIPAIFPFLPFCFF